LLIGHAIVLIAVVIAAILADPRWLMISLLINFPVFYAGWLFFLCNSTQHIGLQDNVSDFRLCCRTFLINPVVQFLYWHMNFHIEHHMYAAVPCYRLGELHRLIRHDLAPCPHGLVATWKQIAGIQKRQTREPNYQYVAPCPTAAPRSAKT
jgi:fatty acid desaturase